MYLNQAVTFPKVPPVGFPAWPSFRLQYPRWQGIRKGVSGFGAVSCGSGLIPTGDALAPCVYPGVTQTSDGTPVAQVGGGSPAQCMQYADFVAAIGGMANCDTHDYACIAANQQKSAALSNLVGGGCVPLGSQISFTPNTSQAAVAAFESNTPVVNNATVNGTPAAGWSVGTPMPTYAPVQSSPAPAPVAPPSANTQPVPPASNVTASSSVSQALQSATTAVQGTDWISGIPNWAVIAGGGAAVLLFAFMGGRH